MLKKKKTLMDEFLELFRDPDNLIWTTEIPLLEIDLSGIEPSDYVEYISLLIEILKDC